MTDQDRPLQPAVPGDRVARDLGHIAERREYQFAGLKFVGHRRRPSGERPPLPRELKASGRFWLGAGIVVLIVWITLFAWPASTNWWTEQDLAIPTNWWTEQDLAILNWLVDIRNDTLTSLAKAGHALGSFWLIRPLRWGIVLVRFFFKRFRALFGVLGSISLVGLSPSTSAWRSAGCGPWWTSSATGPDTPILPGRSRHWR